MVLGGLLWLRCSKASVQHAGDLSDPGLGRSWKGMATHSRLQGLQAKYQMDTTETSLHSTSNLFCFSYTILYNPQNPKR